ncbi:BTB/POZ domain-containing protein 6, partial [Fragariocoptes setiger]
ARGGLVTTPTPARSLHSRDEALAIKSEVDYQRLYTSYNKYNREFFFLDHEDLVDVAVDGDYQINKSFTDVTFIVGPPQHSKKYVGHRVLLAMTSPVFETIFYGDMADKNKVIRIPDVAPIGFENLLRYAYTDSLNLNSVEDAMLTAYAAKKYLLPQLLNHVQPSTVEFIVNRKYLNLYSEYSLFTSVIGWALHESKRRAININEWAAIRSILTENSILKSIRFLSMTIEEFAKCISLTSSTESGEAPPTASRLARLETTRGTLRRSVSSGELMVGVNTSLENSYDQHHHHHHHHHQDNQEVDNSGTKNDGKKNEKVSSTTNHEETHKGKDSRRDKPHESMEIPSVDINDTNCLLTKSEQLAVFVNLSVPGLARVPTTLSSNANVRAVPPEYFTVKRYKPSTHATMVTTMRTIKSITSKFQCLNRDLFIVAITIPLRLDPASYAVRTPKFECHLKFVSRDTLATASRQSPDAVADNSDPLPETAEAPMFMDTLDESIQLSIAKDKDCLVQTFEQIDTNRFITTIPNTGTPIHHIVVFLTSPLPVGLSACIFLSEFSLADPTSQAWHYLGHLTLEKPSAIYKLSGLTLPKQSAVASATNGDPGMCSFSYAQTPVNNCTQIGISVEPTSNVNWQMVPAIDTSPSNVTTFDEFINKTVTNLYNYCSSFAQTPADIVQQANSISPDTVYVPLSNSNNNNNGINDIQVICQSDAIMLKIGSNKGFHGMIYPKGLSNNHTCMNEYYSSSNITYRLPLKACNTMSSDVEDGIEYFNTIMLQPHMRLLTSSSRAYHVRCKYQTREKTISNTHFNVSASFALQSSSIGPIPVTATAAMPSCTMKIFRKSDEKNVAESVRIGDKLIMVIEIDWQEMYGLQITNCVVRDGMEIAEQPLINDQGCPLEPEVMPAFEYTNDSTRATVAFPAHKFPHSSSVYYQCNVRLCIKDGGCHMTDCNGIGGSNSRTPPRRKRYVDHRQTNVTSSRNKATSSSFSDANMSFDVYSGLYVSDSDMITPTESLELPQICMPYRPLFMGSLLFGGIVVAMCMVVFLLDTSRGGRLQNLK